MTEQRAILTASRWFSRRHVAFALPSEHRIVAEKAAGCAIEYLIEGPWLPAVEGGKEPAVVIIFRMEGEPGGPVRMMASFCPADMTLLWEVGTWPDPDAYRRAMEALADGP